MAALFHFGSANIQIFHFPAIAIAKIFLKIFFSVFFRLLINDLCSSGYVSYR